MSIFGVCEKRWDWRISLKDSGLIVDISKVGTAWSDSRCFARPSLAWKAPLRTRREKYQTVGLAMERPGDEEVIDSMIRHKRQ